MTRDNNLVFPLGETYFGNLPESKQATSTVGGAILGMEREVDDPATGGLRTVRLVRNDSNATLALGQNTTGSAVSRVVRFSTASAGAYTLVAGKGNTARVAPVAVIDEKLTTGVPDNDIFWAVTKGSAYARCTSGLIGGQLLACNSSGLFHAVSNTGEVAAARLIDSPTTVNNSMRWVRLLDTQFPRGT